MTTSWLVREFSDWDQNYLLGKKKKSITISREKLTILVSLRPWWLPLAFYSFPLMLPSFLYREMLFSYKEIHSKSFKWYKMITFIKLWVESVKNSISLVALSLFLNWVCHLCLGVGMEIWNLHSLRKVGDKRREKKES